MATTARLPWIGRALQALGINTVPAAGYFARDWSIGTTLALYWVETVTITLLIALRIVLHRRWTRKAGHWSSGLEVQISSSGKRRTRTRGTTFLSGFLLIMGIFTAAHGLFLAIIVFLLLPQEAPAEALRPEDFETGATAMLTVLGIGLAFDLVGIRDRPFRWIERTAAQAQGRMLITHLTIILGMGAMAFYEAPAALFAVFIGLKTLLDLGSLLPDQEVGVDPPRWLRWLDRFGPDKKGQTFSQHFRESADRDRRQREANEKEIDSGP